MRPWWWLFWDDEEAGAPPVLLGELGWTTVFPVGNARRAEMVAAREVRTIGRAREAAAQGNDRQVIAQTVRKVGLS